MPIYGTTRSVRDDPGHQIKTLIIFPGIVFLQNTKITNFDNTKYEPTTNNLLMVGEGGGKYDIHSKKIGF